MKNTNSCKMDRKHLLYISATTAIGFIIILNIGVAGLQHQAPDDKLNFTMIGTGGRGEINLNKIIGQNRVAFCEVDRDYAESVL